MKNQFGGYMLIEALKIWRNEDQGDNIVLSRNEICVLLDEVENPEQEIRWAMTPRELLNIGVKCIIAATRSLLSR